MNFDIFDYIICFGPIVLYGIGLITLNLIISYKYTKVKKELEELKKQVNPKV